MAVASCPRPLLVVLKIFKANPERTTILPRRTIQYALKKLTEKGFLQRLRNGAGSRYQLIF